MNSGKKLIGLETGREIASNDLKVEKAHQ